MAGKLEDVDPRGFLDEVRAFNAAVAVDRRLQSQRQGRPLHARPGAGQEQLGQPLDTPPFEAYAVTCGITFTFGGLRIDPDAGVINVDGLPIAGLYAAGELVGGIFYFNYPGGTGLMSGAVFGRLAGGAAANFARAGR